MLTPRFKLAGAALIAAAILAPASAGAQRYQASADYGRHGYANYDYARAERDRRRADAEVYDRGRRDYRRCHHGSTGTLLGAIAGGLLGDAAIGRRGDHALGAAAGAGAGALIGNAADRC